MWSLRSTDTADYVLQKKTRTTTKSGEHLVSASLVRTDGTVCLPTARRVLFDDFYGAAKIWNSLHEDAVSADRLSLFIRRLERVNINQFLISHGRICTKFGTAVIT